MRKRGLVERVCETCGYEFMARKDSAGRFYINGDPSDDRIGNLELMSRAEHIAHHRDDLQAAKA